MRMEASTIEEVRDMHRMGHTCANLDGRLLFVWGGSDEIRSAGSPPRAPTNFGSSRNQHLWILDTLTGYWRRRTCSGECPPFLSGSTSSLLGQRMFVFGGHSTAQDNWLNELYCLDLDTFVWTDLGSRAQVDPSKPIRSDKNVSWTYKGKFYIFGGYGWSQVEHFLQLQDRQKDFQLTPDDKWPKFGWNNQLVEYDIRLNKWTWPSYSGKCPSARAAHSGTLIGSKYYVFGGRDYRERLNDLHTFCMETFTWTQIAVVGDPNYRRLERPLRHLLEQPEVGSYQDGSVERPASRNNAQEVDVDLDEDDEVDVVEDDEGEDYRRNVSRPSSSAMADSNDSSSTVAAVYLETFTEDHEEDDDISDHPHPSQLPILLERWSIPSCQAAGPFSHTITETDCIEHLNHLEIQATSNQDDQLSVAVSEVDREDANLADVESLIDDIPSRHQAELIEPSEAPEQPIDHQIESPPQPVGRSFSSFTSINDDEILLFGGINSLEEILPDCWLFNIRTNQWRELDLNFNHPRLWHTGSRTDNNEIVIIGGSNSRAIDEFCTDVLSLSMEPKTLKKMALDSVAKSIRMRDINRVTNLPSTICKLIKLRKQARALTTRRSSKHPVS